MPIRLAAKAGPSDARRSKSACDRPFDGTPSIARPRFGSQPDRQFKRRNIMTSVKTIGRKLVYHADRIVGSPVFRTHEAFLTRRRMNRFEIARQERSRKYAHLENQFQDQNSII